MKSEAKPESECLQGVRQEKSTSALQNAFRPNSKSCEVAFEPYARKKIVWLLCTHCDTPTVTHRACKYCLDEEGTTQVDIQNLWK